MESRNYTLSALIARYLTSHSNLKTDAPVSPSQFPCGSPNFANSWQISQVRFTSPIPGILRPRGNTIILLWTHYHQPPPLNPTLENSMPEKYNSEYFPNINWLILLAPSSHLSSLLVVPSMIETDIGKSHPSLRHSIGSHDNFGLSNYTT